MYITPFIFESLFPITLVLLFIASVGTLIVCIVLLLIKSVGKSIDDKQRSKLLKFIAISVIMSVLAVVGFFGSRVLYWSLPCEVGGPCIIEEDRGGVIVSGRDEVRDLIKKYGIENVYIKELDIEAVRDIEFIQKINPEFKEEIGCVIVVYVAGEDIGYVYQEDENLNIIYQETIESFRERTKNVDLDVMTKFYLSLH